VLGVTKMIEVPTGKTVFKKGDVGDALYIVYEGRLRVSTKRFPLLPGKTIAELGPGDMVGEMALLDQPYRTATVTADAPSRLFVLLIASVNELFHKNDAFLKAVGRIAKQRKFELDH
jgi:CRP/FNR family transcriptional regulator, cyclic AMP receptor protein